MAYTPPTMSSPGLMGLPHFRSSRVSRSLWEPVYLNLFTVTIQLPDAVVDLLNGAGAGAADEEKNLVLEGVRKIDGLDTQKVPDTVAQSYKFAKRRFAKSGPTETTIDLSLDFEINVRHQVVDGVASSPSMYTLRVLRMWDDLIYDPLTGTQGLKIEYVAPEMEIIMHDKKGNPFWVWKCYHVFPTAKLPQPAISYDNQEIYKVTGYKLACDYWDEAML